MARIYDVCEHHPVQLVGDDLRQCLWGNLLQEAGILDALSSARYGIPPLDKLIGRGLRDSIKQHIHVYTNQHVYT